MRAQGENISNIDKTRQTDTEAHDRSSWGSWHGCSAVSWEGSPMVGELGHAGLIGWVRFGFHSWQRKAKHGSKQGTGTIWFTLWKDHLILLAFAWE